MIVSTPPASHMYIVKPGDSLSSISNKLFGSAGKWPWFYDDNLGVVGPNPSYIIPGEVLKAALGKHATYGKYADSPTSHKPKHGSNGGTVTVTSATHLSGTLSCSGLETLWDAAGGNPTHAFLAAEIAEAESGGRQYATGSVGERGYWQINPNHGALSTYNPMGNAHAAIVISDDGRDWDAWTTFIDGLFAGRC
jgi:Lysozyme like domain/LysM domain